MHNAWTHYLNSLVRLQRISDFKRLNAIGKAEFHMRHPPPEPVRREIGNGDVDYDYSMPSRVSINGTDSFMDISSYKTFVEYNTDWGERERILDTKPRRHTPVDSHRLPP